MNHRRRSIAGKRSGLALYLVAMLGLVLFSLGALLAGQSAFNISAYQMVRQHVQARYLAEAGLARALHDLSHGVSDSRDSFDLGGGTIAYRVRPGRDHFQRPCHDVLVRGLHGNGAVLLFAKVVVDPSFLMSQTATGTTSSTNRTAASRPHRVVIETLLFPGSDSLGGSSIADIDPMSDDNLDTLDRSFGERVEEANQRYIDDLASYRRAEIRLSVRQYLDSLTAESAQEES